MGVVAGGNKQNGRAVGPDAGEFEQLGRLGFNRRGHATGELVDLWAQPLDVFGEQPLGVMSCLVGAGAAHEVELDAGGIKRGLGNRASR